MHVYAFSDHVFIILGKKYFIFMKNKGMFLPKNVSYTWIFKNNFAYWEFEITFLGIYIQKLLTENCHLQALKRSKSLLGIKLEEKPSFKPINLPHLALWAPSKLKFLIFATSLHILVHRCTFVQIYAMYLQILFK